jgi:hypothetical protein
MPSKTHAYVTIEELDRLSRSISASLKHAWQRCKRLLTVNSCSSDSDDENSHDLVECMQTSNKRIYYRMYEFDQDDRLIFLYRLYASNILYLSGQLGKFSVRDYTLDIHRSTLGERLKLSFCHKQALREIYTGVTEGIAIFQKSVSKTMLSQANRFLVLYGKCAKEETIKDMEKLLHPDPLDKKQPKVNMDELDSLLIDISEASDQTSSMDFDQMTDLHEMTLLDY